MKKNVDSAHGASYEKLPRVYINNDQLSKWKSTCVGHMMDMLKYATLSTSSNSVFLLHLS